MKTVALVGFAETTRDAVVQSKADEIWTVNWAYHYNFIPRIDRLFEMHPVWVYPKSTKIEYDKMRSHWRWLHQARSYPVYMLQHVPGVPNCISFPLKEVVEHLFGTKLQKGGDSLSLFKSSVDYMLALAIHEGFERIELYGIEMGSDTEYRYQREGCMFWVGQAIARGIEVYVPENAVLFSGKKYGYEGGQMIFRQDLERLKEQVLMRKDKVVARMQFLEGQLTEAMQNTLPTDNLQMEHTKAREDVLLVSAFEQTIDYLIKELDLEENLTLEIQNPLYDVQFEDTL